MGARRRKRTENVVWMKSIAVIVIIFLIVISVQIFKLKEKDDLLKEREEILQQQLVEEEARSESLVELNLYTQSTDYIKDMANKMGLVLENEIIFKENDE